MIQRIKDDPGVSERGGGSPFQKEDSVIQDEQNNTVHAHSSSGFRRALRKTSARNDRLAGQLPARGKKANYFAQGGKRHGLHIGAGAPFTGSSEQEGETL